MAKTDVTVIRPAKSSQKKSKKPPVWYYWRWKIECFFKLVKSAGHHLESWQQESALAIAKRLLVTSMALVPRAGMRHGLGDSRRQKSGDG